MEAETNNLYDKIVGTIMQNVIAESNRADGKVILWDFHPAYGIDRLYYYVACMVADIYKEDIYLEMSLFDYLKFKWKNKKRKNLHWVWRKHTSIPTDCRTSVYILMDFIREYYDIPITIFDDIVKEYYENTDN
jgi:hypothetical protein